MFDGSAAPCVRRRWRRRLGARARVAAAMLAAAPAAGAVAPYRHFAWQPVANGVWFGTTRPDSFQTGNTVIVALPTGRSLVVDAQNAAFLAREIIAKAAEVAPGPVRYLVDTHLHQDHVGGNAAFRRAFAGVRIVAHRNTCVDMPRKTVPRMRERIGPMTEQVAALDRRIAGMSLYLDETRSFVWEAPDLCLDLRPGQWWSVEDGGRPIAIGYFGRAHATGDLVVYLPDDKVLAVADLWAENTGEPLIDAGLDGRDGSVLEGPVTQRATRAIDFDIALPGHSAAMRGKAALDAAIRDGEGFVARIRASADRGDNVEEALQRIPPPAGASSSIAARWRRVVISGFEEVELRRELGLPPSGDATSPAALR